MVRGTQPNERSITENGTGMSQTGQGMSGASELKVSTLQTSPLTKTQTAANPADDI